MKITSSLLLLALLYCSRIEAQTYDTNNATVQTFVGSGFYGHVDGQGTQTMFNNPSSIVVDSSSNFFVLDNSNYRIRKITPGGLVTTFIGGGQSGPPGYGTNVSLQNYYLNTMAIDHANVLWLTTSYALSLLRVGTDGLVQVVPLNGISSANGLCVDSRNNVYISDSSGNRIYRLRTNLVLEVFAGSGNQGAVDGNGIFNSFNYPSALAVDSADNLYVWDTYNYLVRRISQGRDVLTIAGRIGVSSNADGIGTNASFNGVAGMVVDYAGNLILSASGSYYNYSGSSIRRMSPNASVTTLAGNFSQTGYANGPGAQALFSGASGVCVSQGMIFIADAGNQRIRSISFDPVPQLVTGANLALNIFPGLQITGVVGRTYRIESSTNMSTWNSEATILLTRSPYLWIDENALAEKKFYRAFLLP